LRAEAPDRRLGIVMVLCASCGASVEDGPACAECGDPVHLEGRYRLLSVVGQGAAGVTYRGEAIDEGRAVAVKEMPLRRTVEAKARERMVREAHVLRQLDHPRVPAYVDHFEAGSGKQRAFYLVQAFIEGPTLTEEMAERRYTCEEVTAILCELLDVLGYLHGLQPPVVHRDLKPNNVIRRRTDGRLVLIDFGAVRDVLKDPALGGSTVAGTYGYMAPEQFRGDASPASDLYALGVLAVVLLSRRDPLDLVKPDHSLEWAAHVHATPGLQAVIGDLLVADPAARPQSASAVAKRLRAPHVPTATSTTTTALVAPKPYLHRPLATAMAFVTAPFGGHNFYLGRTGRGIVSVLFFWTLIPLFLSIADGLRFANMSRDRFDAEFNPEWLAARASGTEAGEGLEVLQELARVPGQILDEVLDELGREFKRHTRRKRHKRRKHERDL